MQYCIHVVFVKKLLNIRFTPPYFLPVLPREATLISCLLFCVTNNFKKDLVLKERICYKRSSFLLEE